MYHGKYLISPSSFKNIIEPDPQPLLFYLIDVARKSNLEPQPLLRRLLERRQVEHKANLFSAMTSRANPTPASWPRLGGKSPCWTRRLTPQGLFPFWT